MTSSSSSSSSNKDKDLKNHLNILEKFLELKSNECAYYRTKVHLIQMSSLTNKTIPQSSTDENSIANENQQILKRKIHRKKNFINHLPFSSSNRYDKKTCGQNQNYYEEKTSLTINEKNLIEQTLLSYLNKHSQQSSHDKNIQCNDNEFYQSSSSSNTILILELSHKFIQSLIRYDKKRILPKLKVHISSKLIQKLSQFGTISACINHENFNNKQEFQNIHAKAQLKPTIIRHIATRKKRHLHKSHSTSYEEIDSKTNVTQTIEILSSTDQISYEKIKKNKRKF